jgi:hypothetical protein
MPSLTRDPQLKAELFAAFDLHVPWNKPRWQATVSAEITEATLRALPALTDHGATAIHRAGWRHE